MIDEVGGWIAAAERVVVLTGAGISTDSGIPDFRGPNGVWTKDPKAELRATLQVWMSEPEVRRAAWRNRAGGEPYAGVPNPGHLALADLDRLGRLHALITQNVDGLHHVSGVDPARIVEIHGNVREWRCMACDARGPMAEAVARVRAGEDDPACLACGGILKAATISFGQALVPEDVERAESAARQADVFLAVGSTLQVHPVAGVVPVAKRAGARLVIVNAEPTPFDPIADAVLHGSISDVLPALVNSRPER